MENLKNKLKICLPLAPISLLLVIVIAFASPIAALAQATANSSFTTTLTTYGVDAEAPSIPQNLVATPIASSQINLTWDASTDNFAVVGYRIFRDSVFLATTTNTTYFDTGLSASTTYAYAVEAFDFPINLSGLSTEVSTTTFAAPVPPEPPVTPGTVGGTTGGSSGTMFMISNLRIVPSTNEALVSFETNMPSQVRIFWGTTADYESGSLSGLIYGNFHQMKITGLEPGTKYFIRVEAANAIGAGAIEKTSFITLTPLIEKYSLMNPSDFKAVPEDKVINLSWNNPSDQLFDGVRVVRSETFFPKDQFDGVPVYEGRGESFTDANVTVGKTYYYAIFSKGKDGSYSSGALAKAKIAPAGEIQISYTDPFADIPESLSTDPKIRELTLADFDFIQEGKLLQVVRNETIAINGSENLTIRLKYEKVPEILKTIGITLSDPKDKTKSFTFLLRINSDKTYYEATIGNLGRSGSYSLSIVILDYANQGLKRIHGNLQALAFNGIAQAVAQKFDSLGLLILFLLCLLMILLGLIARKFIKKNEGKKLEEKKLEYGFSQIKGADSSLGTNI